MYRVDENQKQIVKQLRAFGASVHSLAMVGNSFPDIICGYKGKNFLFEIKTDTGKLSPGQVEFQQNWNGQVCTIYCAEHAIKVMQFYGEELAPTKVMILKQEETN